jgi:thymidylate kinase
MLAETQRALDTEGREVRRVHAGKPPSTPLTFLPHQLLPLLRTLAPAQRSTRVDARHVALGDGDGLRLPPFMFAVRAVLLAHDRRALLRRAHAAAADGAVVLCDRYPSSVTGAPDSPQLARWAGATAGHPVLARLVRAETRMYADVPPADVVFHLWAPLEVTLQRNRQRDKTEPEELVTLRHHQATSLRFDGCPVHRIGTTHPLVRSVEDVVQLTRETLRREARSPDGVDRSSSI